MPPLQVIATSVQSVNNKLKKLLQWNEDGMKYKRHIRVTELKNTGIHTFIGMVGYCSKDRNEAWFTCVHKEVSEADVEQGAEEHILYGKANSSKQLGLNHNNIMDRACLYGKYRGDVEEGFEENVLRMIRSGKYTFNGSFVAHQGCFNRVRAQALWKTRTHPQDVTPLDVDKVLYKEDGFTITQRPRYFREFGDAGAPGGPPIDRNAILARYFPTTAAEAMQDANGAFPEDINEEGGVPEYIPL